MHVVIFVTVMNCNCKLQYYSIVFVTIFWISCRYGETSFLEVVYGQKLWLLCSLYEWEVQFYFCAGAVRVLCLSDLNRGCLGGLLSYFLLTLFDDLLVLFLLYSCIFFFRVLSISCTPLSLELLNCCNPILFLLIYILLLKKSMYE
jgi:hypothetical protein